MFAVATIAAPTVTADKPSAVSRPPALVVRRDRWLRLYPIALGLGGLAGALRTTVALGAPDWSPPVLTALSFVAWLTITLMYVIHGGADPRAFIADLRHPDQGFALGYISLIPLVLLAQIGPRTQGLRILDLALTAAWAIGTAALVADWITTPRERHLIHPGFSLPVIGGPFIACISLQANGWHTIAHGLFGLGVFFWMTFGTVIIGRLMTEQRLSDSRFPTLAALMVPPATASVAWFSLNHNMITDVGIGLAAVLAMMTLVQLFIVPQYLRRPFSLSFWTFSFPLSAAANTVAHWAVAAPEPAARVLAWSAVSVAGATIALLAALTVRMVFRSAVRSTGQATDHGTGRDRAGDR